MYLQDLSGTLHSHWGILWRRARLKSPANPSERLIAQVDKELLEPCKKQLPSCRQWPFNGWSTHGFAESTKPLFYMNGFSNQDSHTFVHFIPLIVCLTFDPVKHWSRNQPTGFLPPLISICSHFQLQEAGHPNSGKFQRVLLEALKACLSWERAQLLHGKNDWAQKAIRQLRQKLSSHGN